MKSYFAIFCFLMLFVAATFTTSFAQTVWTKDAGNPLLTPGPTGSWNDYSLFPFCILFEGSTYHMWYGGHDGTTARIGYATSADGITWTEYAGNPVLDVGEGGSWDDEYVGAPYVLFDGSTYHMWYDGDDGTDGSIGYATSPDGITWTKYAGNPVMLNGAAGSWAESDVGNPCIRFDGSTYHMWFYGWNASTAIICIGYATSADGITWTPYANNPVLTPDAGKWDKQRVEAPDVHFDGNTYHMWYTGGNTTSWWRWRQGYATSTDGITWIKYADNPILALSAGSWDSQWAAFGRVLWDADNSQYKMWYGGGSENGNAKFGYAAPITALEELNSHNYSNEFTLNQNYPNPFNPSTAISYQLPAVSQIELSIYNILGQKVVTLVSGQQPAGSYKVEWDASGFVSGIYFFRLETDKGFVQSKKLILLK